MSPSPQWYLCVDRGLDRAAILQWPEGVRTGRGKSRGPHVPAALS